MYFFFLLGFIFTQYFFLNQFNSESKSNDNISDNQSWLLEHSATQLQTKLVNYKSSFHFLLDENQYVYFTDRLLSNYADIGWLS